MILYHMRKGAARVILCSALVISTLPMFACASSGDSGRLLEAQFEDEEGFRLFRYRTLKALNTLRDAGMTPQAIVETLAGANSDDTDGIYEARPDPASMADSVSGYAGDIAQDISNEVQERTREIVQDATDKAAEAAGRQMSNWVDRLGQSIGQALRDAIDQVLGT